MRSSGILKNLNQPNANLPVVIDRIPKLCASRNELRAGDRLVFIKSPRNKAIGGKISSTQQSLLNEEGGHSQACHTGFVVNINGELKLAHLMGRGFCLESLNDPDAEFSNKYLKMTTMVFRPTKHVEELNRHLSDLVAERLHHEEGGHESPMLNEDGYFLLDNAEERANLNTEANRALENKKLRDRVGEGLKHLRQKFKLKWSVTVAIRSFLHRLVASLRLVNTDPDKKYVASHDTLQDTVIAKDSICSKYDADTYVSAANRMTKEDPQHRNFRSVYMNASTLTTPKTLWAYLARNFNYDYFVMPHVGAEILDKIAEKIRFEIDRLSLSKNVKAQDKAQQLVDLLANFNRESYTDELRASIRLLQEAKPILLLNTGTGAKTPLSYKNVMRFAREQGIYPEHIHRHVVEPQPHQVTELAKQHYGYSHTQAKRYSRYRRLGFSDREAKFECNNHPDFGDWFKLSPGRNIALTCTIVGFFAWVLPRGLARAHEVTKRNASLPQDDLEGKVEYVL